MISIEEKDRYSGGGVPCPSTPSGWETREHAGRCGCVRWNGCLSKMYAGWVAECVMLVYLTLGACSGRLFGWLAASALLTFVDKNPEAGRRVDIRDTWRLVSRSPD